MLTVIEGIDGTGKTTVAANIAYNFNINYRHYPVDYKKYYSVVYNKDLAMAFDMVCNQVDPSLNWIIDRYLQSSWVYGMDINLYNMLKMIVPKVDKNILLICDPNVAYKRMMTRGLNNLDPDIDKLEGLQEEYMALPNWDLIVDTTSMKVTEVYNEVKLFTEISYNSVL